jgi:hypothetical protein
LCFGIGNDKLFSQYGIYKGRLSYVWTSDNIDTNVSVGTIFSIYKRVTEKGTTVSEIDFLHKRGNQIAAGYILYGTSTMLVYTSASLFIVELMRWWKIFMIF